MLFYALIFSNQPRLRIGGAAAIRWLLLLSALCFAWSLPAQVITVSYTGGAFITPPSNGVAGNSAITFTVQNTNATPVNLLEVSTYTTTAYSNAVYTLWYSATSLGGTATIASPAWTQVATSAPIPVTAAGNQVVLQNLSMLIPAGTTYRFALQSSLGIVYAGSTASPASPNAFTSGGITVSTGNATNGGNVGYGGAFPSPANNPRSFAGILTFGTPTPCSGTPSAVTVSSLASVCPTQTINLSLSGLPPATSGLTYQWASSTNGTTYTPIAGATNPSYSTTISTATYFQCNITCAGSGLSAVSTPVQVMMNSFLSCYCNSAATSTADDDIGRFTFGTLTNPASPPSPLLSNPTSTATYTNFTTLAPVSYFKGVAYPISVQQINSAGFYACYAKVFIDYNQNGLLTDPGEEVFASGPTVNGGSGANLLSGSVLIPLTAASGTTLLRVVLRESGTATSTTPCGTYTWGETEDYLINIISPSGCIGATAGITTSTLPSVCPTQSFTLAMPNTVVASNITYQWQSSPDNITWSNIASGTSINHTTTQSIATWYRCIVTCTNVSVSDTSIPVQVQMNSFLTCYCNSTASSTADEDIFAVTVNGVTNASTCTSVGPGPGSVQNKYSNYTTIAPFAGSLGGTIPFSVQIGTCGGNYTNAVKIFIDFNQNGSLLDPGEAVYASPSGTSGPHTETGSFVVPATAATGNTLMRVVNVETSVVSSITPCATYTWGETEDYLFNIAAPIPFNGQLSGIFNPNSGCGLTSCEDLSFSVKNVGTAALTSIPYTYALNGGTPVSATLNLAATPLTSGDSALIVVPCGLNLSTPGTYAVQIAIQIPGDTDPILDTKTKTVISIPTITTFPYTQGFDNPVNPAGGWEVGTGSGAGTWALGTPAKSVINSPASAPNSWITNLGGNYNNNEKSWVQSPCLDLSALVLPVLELSVWWDAEFSWDGMIVQSSLDGGATWQNVGAYGDPTWYNDNSVSGMTGLGTNQDAWSGSGSNGSGGWITAKHVLTGLGGQSGVRLRVAFGSDGSVNSYNGVAFDDILIYDTPAHDVGTSSFTAPEEGDCGDDSMAVFVVIINGGLNPETGFPVTVLYNNGTGSQGSISTTYTGTILPNTSDTVYVGTFSSLAGGLFSFTTYTSLPTDGFPLNDTTDAAIFLNGVPAAPLAADVYKCLPDSFLLGVTQPGANMHYTWYDAISGGNALDTGVTYMTPFVSQNTTWYVGVQGEAQYLIRTTMTGSTTTPFPNYLSSGLEFTTTYPMTLDSVTIIPTGPGVIQLIVNDPASGQTVGTGVSYTVSVPSGNTSPVRIPAGIVIPGGGTYQLLASATSTVPNLRYHFNGASYPYAAGSVAITGATTGSTIAYFFFYDWRLTTYGCPSLRTPVLSGIYPAPVVSLGPDQSICGGDTLDGGNSWLTTVWSRDGVVLGNSPAVFADTSGTYALVVTDNNGCVGTDDVVLMVNPLPEVDLGKDTTVCGSLVMDAGNPSSSFAWSCDAIPSFTQTLQVVLSGNYCVTVTNLFGCQQTDTLEVTVNQPPVFTLGNDLQTCTPTLLGLSTPIPHTTCVWILPGGTPDSNCTVLAAAAGTYQLQVTDTLGCTGTDNIGVNFQAPPTVNIGGGAKDTVCNAVTLNAGNPGSTYLWTLPGGGTATSKTVQATTSGVYKVQVTNGIGCKSRDSVEVVINVTPVISHLNIATPGLPFEYEYTAVSTGLDVGYTWVFTGSQGASFTATGVTVRVVYPPFNDYYQVQVIATNACGTDSTLDVHLVTAMDGNPDGLSVSLTPNPSEGHVRVQVAGNAAEGTLMITDLTGKVLLSRLLPAGIAREGVDLDLTGLAKGTYLFHLRTAAGTVTRKIVLY